ncbi:MAG: hypothetical protein KAQ87_05220 [Candidatus Pacebacteria bacterium]|nr:hypothetical protein [Candidatus Paceibacterota bacterium]
MKKVNTKRFQQKNPENISFQGDSIPQKPLNTAKNTPLPSEEKKNERTNETISERTNERTVKDIVSENSYVVIVPTERVKIRHSFDIFEDQKTALDKIQMALKDSGQKRKPVLGEMVQEAIDLYVKEKSRKLNNLKIIREQSSERTNERS